MNISSSLGQQIYLSPVSVPGISFRLAHAHDLRALRANCYPETDWEQFRDHYEYLLKWQENGRCVILVGEIIRATGAQPTHEIIAGGQLIHQGDSAEIAELSVRADYRNRGVGTDMIHLLTQIARERKSSILEIGVEMNNVSALRLYRRLGFGEERTVWLPNAQEAVYLTKRLRVEP